MISTPHTTISRSRACASWATPSIIRGTASCSSPTATATSCIWYKERSRFLEKVLHLSASARLQSVPIPRLPAALVWVLHLQYRNLDADRGAELARVGIVQLPAHAGAGCVFEHYPYRSVFADWRCD